MITFIQELRRRTVFKVTGMYVVVSWVLAQAGIVLQTALRLPNWFNGVVVGLLLLGLPVAMLLAWAFEVTPEGVRRTEPLVDDQTFDGKAYSIVDGAIVVGLCLILMFTIMGWRSSTATHVSNLSSQPFTGASIAVLPFVDMSSTEDQAYFGEGIAEEILNILARSPELSVAARTSSFRFRNEEVDLREIGDALNVAFVLEGSVKRDGDRLRISAQLARVSDGFNLWVESYDRDVVDLFQVQDDIANAIAIHLQASLERDGTKAMGAHTQNIAAYDAFLKGNALFRQRGENVFEAIKLYEASVRLDPEFAPAWANLAIAYATLPRWSGERNEAAATPLGLKAKAERAAAQAIAHDPELAASQHALGVTLRDRWQWSRSEDAFVKALAIAPDQPEILEDYVELLGMLGSWEEAAKHARRLVELDPAVGVYLFRLGVAERNVGNYEAALSAFERQRIVAKETSANNVLGTVAMVAEMRGLSEAEAYLLACETCIASQRDVAGALLNAAINHDAEAVRALDPSQLDNAEFLVFLAGGSNVLIDKLESLTALDRYAGIAQETPGLKAIRTSDRYKALVKETGLADYWRERGWPHFCQPAGDSDFMCGVVQDSNGTVQN